MDWAENVRSTPGTLSKGRTTMKTIKGNKSGGRSGEAKEVIAGIAWYYPEQWGRLLDVSVDRNSLETTHEAWLRLAEKAMFDIKRSGISPRKVYIDVEKLVAWCKAQNRPVDGAARAEFVQTLLTQKVEEV
jgi:hypothetical protein